MSVQQKTIYLKDYRPPEFLIDTVHLHIDLWDDYATVKAILSCRRNPISSDQSAPFRLNGEELELKKVVLDGAVLNASAYAVDSQSLTILQPPKQFTLETEVVIYPHLNFQLSGLYRSRGNYCTQCEAHGFRRITYFLDRPDVMSQFTTAISADKTQFPILLSNGNAVDRADLDNNRHWVLWNDPSLKTCYLFA